MDNMLPGDTTVGQNATERFRRKSYSEVVIEGVRRRARVFVWDPIVRKNDRALSKGDDMVVCFPRAKIEATGNSTLTIGLVYRSPNINEEDNRQIQDAIKEVSKGECIIMGDFNHGQIQWESLESTGGEDQQFLLLIQVSFLTQHVLEPVRGENVLGLVLSSQNELVDNVKIHEPFSNIDHNQIHFYIKVKSERINRTKCKTNFHKSKYKDMRKYLAKLDGITC